MAMLLFAGSGQLYANGTANGFEQSSNNYAVTAVITNSGDQTVTYSSPKFQVSGIGWNQPGTFTITVTGQTVSAVSLIGGPIQWLNWGWWGNITFAAGGGVATATISGNLNVTKDVYFYYCTSNQTLYYSGSSIASPPAGCVTAPTFYSCNGQDLSLLSKWWSTTTCNSGSSPGNFTTAGDVFIVQSGHSSSMLSNTAITGNLSIKSGATLALSTNTLSLGTGLDMELSSVITGTNTITITGNVNFTGAGAQTTISNNIEYSGAQKVFNVANGSSAVDVILSGVISSSTGMGLTKAGTGTLQLQGANTYTGNTNVTTGVLQLGAAGCIADASSVVLNGGTFSTGSGAGYNETLGTLDFDADNASTDIALGTGSHTITFSNSSALTWSGTSMVITGWTGTGGASGTAGKIFVGSDASGLTGAQLAKINFSGYRSGALLLVTGELVPVPFVTYYVNDGSFAEGSSWCTAAGANGAGCGGTGNPCATLEYVVENLTLLPGDIIKVDKGSYSHNQVTCATSGTAASPIVIEGNGPTGCTINKSVGGGGGEYVGELIYSNNHDYWTIKNITLTNNAGAVNANDDAIEIDDGSTNWIIDNCTVTCNLPYGAAIEIEGDNCTVQNCTLNSERVCVYLENTVDGCDVKYNTMITSKNTVDCFGFESGGAENFRVFCNKIKAGTGDVNTGIMLDGQSNSNIDIYNNYVSGFNTGIYAWAGGVSGNIVGLDVYHNSIYADQMAIDGYLKNFNIKNNIMYITSTDANDECIQIRGTGDDPATLNYNHYWHPNAGVCASRNWSNSATLAAWKTAFPAWDVNSRESNPLFVNPGSANLDLQATSPSIDNGVNLGILNDVYNHVRPYGAGYDIGAYEWGSTTYLPITLIYFNASCMNGKNVISWITESQINNDYFAVEKSLDGVNFDVLQIVDGAGNSNITMKYSVTDTDQGADIVYYRLIDVDYNGDKNSSNIILASCNNNLPSEKAYIKLLQSPDEITLLMGMLHDNSYQLKIINAAGQIVMNKSFVTDKNSYSLHLQNHFANGIYFINLTGSTERITEKFLLLRNELRFFQK